MPAQYPFWPGSEFHSVHGALNVALHLYNNPERRHAAEKLARVFLTISREPGAGGVPLAQRLAERLNAHGPGDWSAWDQELVEKVSAEYHLKKGVIETVNERPHNWLNDLVSNFSQNVTPSDLGVFKKVAGTIRALATAGHAILVGRGGRFITNGLAGGIHLRLVAPLEYRVKTTAESFNLSLPAAAKRLAEIDRNRTVFYRQFWPGKSLEPQSFTMTLNSAELSLDEMVACVLPLVRLRDPGASESAGESALPGQD
ncbi:MAG: cytidylate kinase-like family protein [Tepidisphaeraceae bacterium]|jgi:cytidylate kinase